MPEGRHCMKFTRHCASLLMILMLSACGGGGGDGTSHGGDSGDGGSGPGPLSSCQASFSTEKLAEGQDCTPIAGTLCPGDAHANLLQSQPIACPGVAGQQYEQNGRASCRERGGQVV